MSETFFSRENFSNRATRKKMSATDDRFILDVVSISIIITFFFISAIQNSHHMLISLFKLAKKKETFFAEKKSNENFFSLSLRHALLLSLTRL
jgi:hypothetical protein